MKFFFYIDILFFFFFGKLFQKTEFIYTITFLFLKEKVMNEFVHSNWIGTWNNYGEGDADKLIEWSDKYCSFIIIGDEIGASGTPHLQIYAQMCRNHRFSTFRKIFPGLHIEPHTYGDGKDIMNYCSKETVLYRSGELKVSKKGTRSDLELAGEMILRGADIRAVATNYPRTFLNASSGISRMISIFEKPRDFTYPKIVSVIYGPTGTGKTRRVYEYCKHNSIDLWSWHPGMGEWFDGYSGQKHVLFDEFRGQLPFGMLLRLLDVYPMLVQVKGGFRQFSPDIVYITSPYKPEHWYSNLFLEDKIDQLLRRLYVVTEVTDNVMEVPFTIIGTSTTPQSSDE